MNGAGILCNTVLRIRYMRSTNNVCVGIVMESAKWRMLGSVQGSLCLLH